MSGMALPAPTLRTARLLLRPFTDDDADALYALHSNASVLRYWDSPPWSERQYTSGQSPFGPGWAPSRVESPDDNPANRPTQARS